MFSKYKGKPQAEGTTPKPEASEATSNLDVLAAAASEAAEGAKAGGMEVEGAAGAETAPATAAQPPQPPRRKEGCAPMPQLPLEADASNAFRSGLRQQFRPA
jgi:hypothetical protein